MKKLSLILTGVFCTWIFILSGYSGPIAPINVNNEEIALKGYDPVAYFILNRPVKGQNEYQFKWNNATWLFANKSTLQCFK